VRLTRHEWLRERKEHDEQTRPHCIEFRLNLRPDHIRKRYTESATQHQVRNNSQRGQKDSEAEKEDREGKPFDTAQVRSYV